MELHQYGIRLVRLQQGPMLEQLRLWRNDPAIQVHMEYREHITPEMQQAWFASLHEAQDFYWLIYPQGQDAVGLIHARGIGGAGGQVPDTGLFIADKAWQGTWVPLAASFTMLNWLFYAVGAEEATAKVQRGNQRAVRYNQALGFVYGQPLPNGYDRYRLFRSTYVAARLPHQLGLARLYPGPLQFLWEPTQPAEALHVRGLRQGEELVLLPPLT